MKKWMAVLLAAALLLAAGGCSIKVKKDTFSIPMDLVKSVEVQREYFDEQGKAYFCRKLVTGEDDMVKICDIIRTLPVERASKNEPHPITDFPIIVILRGAKDHHLILTENMAYYDRLAYTYKDNKTFEVFKTLYDNLGYAEEPTDPDRF